MDPTPPHFRPRSGADVIALVKSNPLAWLVAAGAGPRLLPLRPVIDEGGALVGFSGHMPRHFGLFKELALRPQATILFTGRDAYASPSWVRNRTWAPTWLSMSATFDCRFTFSEDPKALTASLDDLISAMEDGRPDAWSLPEVAARYEGLARQISPFRATIVESRAAFLLGQNESDETFADIVAGLRREGDDEMADAMEAFRPKSR